LKKFIKNAKKNENPVLTPETVKLLSKFYQERHDHLEAPKINITIRHLETLVKLSKARARMALRNETNLEDVKNAIQILGNSLGQFETKLEPEKFDISSINASQTPNVKNKTLLTEQIIRELIDKKDGTVDTIEILDFARSLGIEPCKILL